MWGELLPWSRFAWLKYIFGYIRTLASYGVLLPSLELRSFSAILMLGKRPIKLWFLRSQLAGLLFLQRADAFEFKAVLHAVSEAKVTRFPA